MYSKIEFVKVWPAGNLTALVLTPLSRSVYAEVSRNIFSEDRSIEQVGFIEPSSDSRALARLQMMGGEFCGNATRSLAMFLYKKLRSKCGEESGDAFFLEVSGTPQPVRVNVIDEKEVALEIPVEHYGDDAFQEYRDGTLVKIDGIQHFITEMPEFAHENKDLLRIRASYILHQEGFVNAPATGVIFVEKQAERTAIHPFIWVRDVNSLVYESGCASGTLAAAMSATRNMKDGIQVTVVFQPSGLALTATVQRTDGKFSKAVLSGVVELRETCDTHLLVHDQPVVHFENRRFVTAY